VTQTHAQLCVKRHRTNGEFLLYGDVYSFLLSFKIVGPDTFCSIGISGQIVLV
jgi:hypothetical protein